MACRTSCRHTQMLDPSGCAQRQAVVEGCYSDGVLHRLHPERDWPQLRRAPGHCAGCCDVDVDSSPDESMEQGEPRLVAQLMARPITRATRVASSVSPSRDSLAAWRSCEPAAGGPDLAPRQGCGAGPDCSEPAQDGSLHPVRPDHRHLVGARLAGRAYLPPRRGLRPLAEAKESNSRLGPCRPRRVELRMWSVRIYSRS